MALMISSLAEGRILTLHWCFLSLFPWKREIAAFEFVSWVEKQHLIGREKSLTGNLFCPFGRFILVCKMIHWKKYLIIFSPLMSIISPSGLFSSLDYSLLNPSVKISNILFFYIFKCFHHCIIVVVGSQYLLSELYWCGNRISIFNNFNI